VSALSAETSLGSLYPAEHYQWSCCVITKVSHLEVSLRYKPTRKLSLFGTVPLNMVMFYGSCESRLGHAISLLAQRHKVFSRALVHSARTTGFVRRARGVVFRFKPPSCARKQPFAKRGGRMVLCSAIPAVSQE
jgi:hypothetical protein